MKAMLTIEQRLARVEARQEIEAIIARYAMACDDRDLNELVRLFTEDGIFGSRNIDSGAVGREAIFNYFKFRYASMGVSNHWSHDRLIWFDRDDENAASGIAFGHIETTIDGIFYVAATRYHDEYLRKDDVWLFKRRTIEFLYFVPAEDYSTALTTPLRIRAYGEATAADFPETLSTWQSWKTAEFHPI